MNAPVSFYQWLRVAVMIHNHLPYIQGLFPIPCLVLFYLFLRCALAMQGTCRSESETLVALGISVTHAHKQSGEMPMETNGKSLPDKMMVISAVTQVNQIIERSPATWIP